MSIWLLAGSTRLLVILIVLLDHYILRDTISFTSSLFTFTYTIEIHQNLDSNQNSNLNTSTMLTFSSAISMLSNWKNCITEPLNTPTDSNAYNHITTFSLTPIVVRVQYSNTKYYFCSPLSLLSDIIYPHQISFHIQLPYLLLNDFTQIMRVRCIRVPYSIKRLAVSRFQSITKASTSRPLRSLTSEFGWDLVFYCAIWPIAKV